MKHKEQTDTLRREVELLRELREELDLKRTLARAEARADWEDLEGRFQLAQEEIARLGHGAREDALVLDRASHELQEIRRGYERLRQR
jgi:transposase